VAIIILIRPLLWNKLSAIASEKPQFDNMRVIYRALVGMFVCAYLIFAVWYFRGYIYLRVSYYHANIILLAFLLLGVLFSQRISDYPQHQFKYAIAGAFFIPMIPFALFSLTPQHILITNFWILYGGAIVCLIIALYPKRTLYGLFGFIMFTGAMLHDARHYRSWLYPAYHDVYVADRYMNQSNYEYAIHIMQIINNRYDSLSYETFRLFYNQQDSIHSRLFNSVASSYLWTTENRILIPYADPDLLRTEAQETQELVVLSSSEHTASILEGLNAILDVTELDRYAIGHSRGDIDLIFFRVNKDT
ncbi:MAG: hypothetical protein KJ043_14755, partial [Anaerolineae bacterium]|nr:hypothetical protein [Anaerolineae bacterium]